MRFIVYGAGAVGGSLGALLALSGHDVAFVARGEHLRVIRSEGLTLRTPEAEHRLDVVAVDDPQELHPVPTDVVLLCMKGQDTEAALRRLPRDVPVVCVQNGVANERAALRLFADVYGVCVMFPSTHLTPGVVEANSSPVPGILNIGRYPSGLDDRAELIGAAFRKAGFRSEPVADIMRWKYTKLLMNVGNAVQAVCGSAPEIAALVRQEAEAVLVAAGIDFASGEEDRMLRADTLKVRGARGGGSSWQSLARGTGAVESDYLNGEIVLLGRLHGAETRYNEHARRMANSFAVSRSEAGSMSQDAWLSKMDL